MSINDLLEKIEESALIAKHKNDKLLDQVETLKLLLREQANNQPDQYMTAEDLSEYIKTSLQHIRNLTSQKKISIQV